MLLRRQIHSLRNNMRIIRQKLSIIKEIVTIFILGNQMFRMSFSKIRHHPLILRKIKRSNLMWQRKYTIPSILLKLLDKLILQNKRAVT